MNRCFFCGATVDNFTTCTFFLAHGGKVPSCPACYDILFNHWDFWCWTNPPTTWQRNEAEIEH